MACNCGRGGHGWTHQVRAATLALPAFEIAIGGRSATISLLEAIAIHGNAHRTAGSAPLETSVKKDPVEALRLSLFAHLCGARYDDGLDVRCDLPAGYDSGSRPKVLKASIGAGTNENLIDLDIDEQHSRL
jgi:hypothetical protein